MITIIQFLFNIFRKKKFYYVLLRHDTSIGIGSETIRLSLIKAEVENKRITLVRYKIPFGKWIFTSFYPSSIYDSIRSNMIRNEYKFIYNFIAYYYGTKVLLLSVFFSLLYRKKYLYKQYLYGHEDLYFPYDHSKKDDNKFIAVSKLKRICKSVQNFPNVYLRDNINKECKNALKALNIKENQWYVCLHIRSSFFYNDVANYRNASIDNYYKAIDYIINSGGIVVRLGDARDNFITHPRQGLIDYPNTNVKSEHMDLYLIENCKFYIGTQSGIIDTALLFKKPTLSVNSIHFAIPSSGKYDITIYKKIYNKSTNKILTYDECMKYYHQILTYSFDEFSLNYTWVENSDDEILIATKEMVNNIRDQFYVTDTQKKVQRALKRNSISYGFRNDYLHYQILFSKVLIGKDYAEKWILGDL